MNKVIEEIIAANPYTRYEYPAQNDAVERDRAARHGRMWMQELAKHFTSRSSAATLLSHECESNMACKVCGSLPLSATVTPWEAGSILEVVDASPYRLTKELHGKLKTLSEYVPQGKS